MTHRNKAASLSLLFSSYPSAKATEETAVAYLDGLRDLSDESVALAVEALRRTNTFLPSVAELRAFAAKATGQLPEGDAANEAWGQVLGQVRDVGWVGRPVLLPMTELALQRTVGWRDLCASEEAAMGAHRARFLEAYRGLARQIQDRTLLPEGLSRQVAELRAGHTQWALDRGLRPVVAQDGRGRGAPTGDTP